MLIPALISNVFGRRREARSYTSFHGQNTSPLNILEIQELRPKIRQTIEIAQMYFNNLEEGKGDRLDELIAIIITDLRSLETFLEAKRGVQFFLLPSEYVEIWKSFHDLLRIGCIIREIHDIRMKFLSYERTMMVSGSETHFSEIYSRSSKAIVSLGPKQPFRFREK